MVKEEKRCVLAFCKKKDGKTLAVKLPAGAVSVGDIVDVTGTGVFRVVETAEMIDGGPAYKVFSDCFPIHTALEVFRPYWRRADGSL